MLKTNKFNFYDIFFLVFIGCLIYSLWAVSIGWNNPLLDENPFRQTQTAISTFYLLHGSSWLAYETPVLGDPWSIPMEFPLYQWIVAILVKIFQTPLDQTGRFVSAFFFYLCLIPSYFILKFLDVPKNYRWIFLSLFLTSPLYLFWSRTFMIESLSLFLGLAYLVSVGAYLRNQNLTSIALSLGIVFGILGAIVKITTFTGFLLASSMLTLFCWSKSNKDSSDSIYILFIPLVAFALFPYIAISLWNNFADSQKLYNPIAADFITSNSLKFWNFGSVQQRFSLTLWRDTLARIFNDIWGNTKLILILLIVLPFLGNRKHLYLASMLIFFAAILIFTNLHIIHNYYQYANGIFLIAATGFGLLGILEKQKMQNIWRILGCAILTLLLSLQVRAYQVDWYHKSAENTNSLIIKTATAIQKYTDPNDVILIYGLDWSSELPYYSQRRALAIPQAIAAIPDDKRDKIVKAAIKNLEKYTLGAMLICSSSLNNKVSAQKLLTNNYTLQISPIYTNSLCEIYLPKNPK